MSATADYYAQRDFSDLRSTQDWLAWLGSIDGVFLEGRWLPYYTDTAQLNDIYKRASKASDNNNLRLIPVASGQHLIQQNSYSKEWADIKNVVPQAHEIALRIERDDKALAALKEVSAVHRDGNPWILKVGEVAPPFLLPDSTGTWHRSHDLMGQHGALLFLLPDEASNSLCPILQQNVPPKETSSDLDTTAFIISRHALFKADPSFINLVDKQGDLLPWFGNEPMAVLLDRAGFIRSLQPVHSQNDAMRIMADVSKSLPILEVGKVAPEFSLIDAAGHAIRLADYRGKNVILTFFPKCFTGGCAGHLASLQSQLKVIEDSNTVVLAVSVDSADVQTAFAKSLGVTFPLIPDTSRNISILYGAAGSPLDLALRQSIVIDKDGIVRIIDRAINVSTHGFDIQVRMRRIGLIK